MIPEAIKELKTPLYKEWAEYGYSLAQQELEAKDKEIERLKGLMKSLYVSYMINTDIKGFDVLEAEKAWQTFSEKHNL